MWIAIYEWVTGSYILTATNRFGEELVRLGTMHRSSSLIGNAIDLSHFLVFGRHFLITQGKMAQFVCFISCCSTYNYKKPRTYDFSVIRNNNVRSIVFNS